MPRSTITAALVALTFTLGGLAACDAGPPPRMVAKKDDGVPVNSAAEERLNGTTKPKPAPTIPDPSPPPATPVTGDGNATMTPVPKAGDPKGDPKSDPKSDPKAGDPKGDPKSDPQGDAKITKAECKKLLDRYVTLTISTEKRFPPEMIAQMKASALAQAKKGDTCSKEEITRTQYTCAIASTSTAAWARCLK